MTLAQFASKRPEEDPEPVTLLRASLVWKDTTCDLALSHWAAPSGCARMLAVEMGLESAVASETTAETEATPPATNDGGPSLTLQRGSGPPLDLELRPVSSLEAIGKVAAVRRLVSVPVEVPSGEPLELGVTPPGTQDGGPSLKLSFVA